MCPRGAAPPAAEECLVSSYTSRGQRGGTLIAESVRDVATHEAWMKDPSSYRPEQCRCGGRTLHIHGRRERKLMGTAIADGGVGAITVMVFLCAACRATWRVLPAFLARCLRRTWAVVEEVVQGERARGAPSVPERTARRWAARLRQSARLPGQVLATAGTAALAAVTMAVGLDGDRRALAEAFAARHGVTLLASLAALLHRLSPGIRLM